MVYFEVKRGLLSKDAQSRISMFNELCETISVEELTCDDMDVAATLFATHRHGSTINNSELIIAAQCITRGHTLVTHNVHHFEGIDRLQIVDWAGYKYIPFF
jgi:predicted nucleic acid-binding protein